MSRPAIVFIGFMGAGKSTALAAAREAGLETTEIDALMEAELGTSIAEAFERDGEEAFRGREAEVVGALLEQADGGAIALGGGSVLSERVPRGPRPPHRRLARGRRRGGLAADRPLRPAAGEVAPADVARLLEARRPLYEELADAVVPCRRPWRRRPRAALDPGLGGAARGDEDALGLERLRRVPGLRRPWAARGRLVAAARAAASASATRTSGARYADRVEPLAARVEVEPGEGAKTMAEAERVLRELARAGMTREDHVVALGGGVVGDLAGFCAHTYQRGVPFVQVPTSLVAQVDSAYGGKTGVDLPEGKNYAGAYHLPAAVLSDTSTLATLPPEELAAGFVEVIKTGLLAGGALWERVRAIETLDPADLDDVVFECARYKCAVVAADERDGGLRHVLNLGHTVGHAIEAASGYARYRHGEAVGLGLLAALRLSDAPELAAEVEEILRRHGLPVALDPASRSTRSLDALQRDKKRTAAGVGLRPALRARRAARRAGPRSG